ncbi:hypothetical protein SAMN04487859_11341 [Roseovarius lutimaris]|uniref:Intracellular septation protein A n=1 Tax=Roseovarius lutimaris TaxID=1005928 RepID=A0A1I5DPV6_9RHOB|nr:hypothetical protein [Roseovarius lutimaris]SFO01187.1 hypothetical protein SAMN04487859_11341 [Roseovarius lutimaris]
MVHRFSSRLLNATLSIPAIRSQNLLPVVIMLILWIGLGRMSVPQDQVFVLSVVVAQAYAIWRNLPQAAASLHQTTAGRTGLLRWPVVILLMLSAVQLWLNNPLFTQRGISAVALFLLVIMVLGMMREGDVMTRVTPTNADGEEVYETVSLLRVNALVAAMVIAVNEILICTESLGVWITVMPIFVLFLHGFYWFMVLMVLPPEAPDEDTIRPATGA